MPWIIETGRYQTKKNNIKFRTICRWSNDQWQEAEYCYQYLASFGLPVCLTNTDSVGSVIMEDYSHGYRCEMEKIKEVSRDV